MSNKSISNRVKNNSIKSRQEINETIKNDRGLSLASLILIVLILILIGFLVYEIVYVDIFNIMPKKGDLNVNTNVLDQTNTITNLPKDENIRPGTDINHSQVNDQSIEIYEPINDTFESNTTLVSDRYYYNQLDNYAKIIYDGLLNNKENMKSGTYIIDFGRQFNDLLNSQGGGEKLNMAFQSAWNAYTYDNMDVFYIDVEKLTLTTTTTSIGSFSTHQVELSKGDNTSYLKPYFSATTTISGKLNLLTAIQQEIRKQLEGYSDYEKIREVHNWLIDNIEYDINLETQEPYSISGALTEGRAVCEGYARSFKYIMDGLDIPCVLVSGIGTNSNGETESHAWNYVMLDNKWYAVDVTWDDPVIIGDGYISEGTRYRHFLKGSNSFFTSHIEDGRITESSVEFKFPTLSEEDY